MDHPGQTQPPRAHAALTRDAALARVGTTRRLAIVGTAGLSAALAGFISTSPPSKASTTSAARTQVPTAPQRVASVPAKGKAPSLPPLASASSLGLQGPDQAPGSGGDGNGGQSQPQTQQADPSQQQAPSQQQSQSAAPAPQPGPVSGGS